MRGGAEQPGQTEHCLLLLLLAGDVGKGELGEQGVVDCDIFEEEGGQGGDHLHGDHACILVGAFEASGEDSCDFIATVGGGEDGGVVAEDVCESLLDVEGADGVHEVQHAHDQRVDQIQLPHATETERDFVKRLSYLAKVAAA